MIQYMLDHHMFSSFEEFPFYHCFPSFNDDTLMNVRSYFNLNKLDYEDIYNQASELSMKTHMKDIFKYKSPDFLEHFIITPFLVREFSTTF